MQNVSMSLEGKEVVFNWDHKEKPVTFRVEQSKFIQLVCKECHQPIPLADVSLKYTCEKCGTVINPEGLNHRAEDYGRWVSYLGKGRCKDNYQLLLRDGRIINYAYPNGIKWGVRRVGEDHGKEFSDDDVVAIRLMPDNELARNGELRGRIRLERNVEYNGPDFPKRNRVFDLNGQYGILV